MAKYTLDVDRLSEITGKTQKQIAEELNVSTASLSESKTVPTKKWGFIKNYLSKFDSDLKLVDFIVEHKTDQNDNSK
jgi:DNA-binding NarL/FixJ family response regulator